MNNNNNNDNNCNYNYNLYEWKNLEHEVILAYVDNFVPWVNRGGKKCDMIVV